MVLDTLKKEKQKYFLKRFMEKHKEIKWPYDIPEELLNIEVFDFAPSFNVLYPNVESILRSVDKKIISADVLSTFELKNICEDPSLLARILSVKVILNYLKETSLNDTIETLYYEYYSKDTVKNFLDYLEKNIISNRAVVVEKRNKIFEYLERTTSHYSHKAIFSILKYRSNFDFSLNQLELILDEALPFSSNNKYIYNCHKLLDTRDLSSEVIDGVKKSNFLDLVDFIAVDDKLSESRARWLKYIINDDSTIQYNLLKVLSIFNESNLNALYYENLQDSHDETLKYLSESNTNQTLHEQISIINGGIKEVIENYLNSLSGDVEFDCEYFRQKYDENAYEQYVILLMINEKFKKLPTSQKNYLLKLPTNCFYKFEEPFNRCYGVAEILMQCNDDNRGLIDLASENKELLDSTVEFLEKTNYNDRAEVGKILTSLASKILDDKLDLQTYSQFLEYLSDFSVYDVEQYMSIRGNYFQNHSINDTFDKLNKNDNGKILLKLIHKCNDDISLCQTINLLTNQDIDQDLLNLEILYLTGLDNKQYRQGIESITTINIINQIDDENIKSFILRDNKKLPDKGISKVKK